MIQIEQGDCLEESEACTQPCLKERPHCIHACNEPCHPGSSCPDTVCQALINVKVSFFRQLNLIIAQHKQMNLFVYWSET